MLSLKLSMLAPHLSLPFSYIFDFVCQDLSSVNALLIVNKAYRASLAIFENFQSFFNCLGFHFPNVSYDIRDDRNVPCLFILVPILWLRPLASRLGDLSKTNQLGSQWFFEDFSKHKLDETSAKPEFHSTLPTCLFVW